MTTEIPQRFLNHHRREMIAALVDEQGAVRVRELTEKFGVSNMTIRRDIEALASSNRVQRVHGGATRVERAPRSADEPGFRTKLALQREEKAAIAVAAAQRVSPGSAIGVTAGTTTYQLANHLADIPNLTVVTNSIPIASALSLNESRGSQIVITGGSPTPSNAIVGPLADRSLAGLHLDQVFMGVHGMGETSGFTTPNLAEAQTNQAFIRATREVVVVADANKWGLTGLGTIAQLADAHALITDSSISSESLAILRREIPDVQVVDAD